MDKWKPDRIIPGMYVISECDAVHDQDIEIGVNGWFTKHTHQIGFTRIRGLGRFFTKTCIGDGMTTLYKSKEELADYLNSSNYEQHPVPLELLKKIFKIKVQQQGYGLTQLPRAFI